MAECIVDTFGIVQDFADLHGDISTTSYQAIMDVMVSRQREEIVRCRDCREYNTELYRHITCELLGRYVEPDFFCAYGERREA